MALPENPITRKETYLAKIAGQEVQIPDVPITREEAYLNQIAKEGMGTKVIANPEDVAEDVLNKVEIDGEVYSLPSGGGGGSNDYTELNNKPQINGVELKGNKTTNDLGIDKTAVGLGNVPNVSTNDQEPTFTQASTRNNIASGEKLSVILGKIQKFFNDLKTVAFSGSYTDLSNKPQINSVELSGNKTTSDLGINADNVMMSDGVTSVENRINTCTYDAFIDISSYTSTANYYTCPSDGYTRITSSGNAVASISMLKEDLTDRVGLVQTQTVNIVSIFCKKGAKIYVENAATAKFISLG